MKCLLLLEVSVYMVCEIVAFVGIMVGGDVFWWVDCLLMFRLIWCIVICTVCWVA